MLPYSYTEELQKFEQLIVWKKVQGSDIEIPEPKQGLDGNFDQANVSVNNVKSELEYYLQGVRN